MLYLQDELTHPEGSHFTHPRKGIYPQVKDALTKAGIADFEPQLIALEEARDKDAVLAAYSEVHKALIEARHALDPTARELELAAIEGIHYAMTLINPSGPTEVIHYQDAWAMVSLSRDHLYELLESDDVEVKSEAKVMVSHADDLFIMMPDPAITAPLDFDPAMIEEVLDTLNAEASAA